MSHQAILGQSGNTDIAVDLDCLVGSHMAIVANAGGGKSGAIRRLLETTHGHIQHIVLDIEDEFYTLRQSYDYVIAGGESGDVPAKPENAAALATAALTHGFSMIVQMNDLGSAGAADFVDRFLSAMLSAPQELWHPVLVVIDETQRFDPASIRMLTERGRKRGFTAVLASQRLPKIDANIRGDINNWIMGRVGQSLDRRIMADQLGFSAREATEHLQRIQPRHFWAFGPALADEPLLFRVGDVETTMVKPGQGKVATPPPPEAMRSILAGLAVVESPKDTGEAADDNRPSDQALLERIAGLETELRNERGKVARLAGAIEAWNDRSNGEVLTSLRSFMNLMFDVNNELFGTMSMAGLRPIGRPANILDMTIADFIDEIPAQGGGGSQREQEQDGAKSRGSGSPAAAPVERAPVKPQRVSGNGAGQGVTAGETAAHPPRQQRILDSLAWAVRMLGKDQVERNIVAWFADTSPKSSGYQNDLGAMRTAGLIEYPSAGMLSLTQRGGEFAKWPATSPTKADLLDAIKRRLEPRFHAILDHLFNIGLCGREELADAIGRSASSSGFQNDLGKLRTLGLVDYPRPGAVSIGKVFDW